MVCVNLIKDGREKVGTYHPSPFYQPPGASFQIPLTNLQLGSLEYSSLGYAQWLVHDLKPGCKLAPGPGFSLQVGLVRHFLSRQL